MKQYKYADNLAAGTVAAGGTLGILIPPSAALIIYGILTEEGIAELFAAGIIPGIISVILYIAVIMIVTHFKPEMGPRGVRKGWKIRFQKLYRVWGIVLLFFLILGGISFGVFTPNEAGGIGATEVLSVFREQALGIDILEPPGEDHRNVVERESRCRLFREPFGDPVNGVGDLEHGRHELTLGSTNGATHGQQ